MKIAHIDLFAVAPRWLFLKLTTDAGIVGWGEPVVEGRAKTVAAAVEELSPYLIGKDARHIEDIWQVLYRGGFYRGGPVLMSALAGIDQALWDIKGKALGVPVYELLGGAVRDKMKMYCWIGGDSPSNLAQEATARRDQGYQAIKMNGCGQMEWIDSASKVEDVVAGIAAVREAVGTDLDVGLDFHGRVHKGMVKRLLRALEPYQPFFVEEPLLPEHSDALAMIYPGTSIPIATGERLYSRWDFKEILHAGVVDIIQPDVSHAGGISEVRRIAAMAEAYDVALAPHCPLGPIALAASLQLDFALPNALIQESSIDIHYNTEGGVLDYLVDPTVFTIDKGFIDRPSAPGLGIEIDEDKVRAAAERGHDWKNPIWRNPDGSFTEW
jgi:galactonate dehydratase